MKEGKKELRIRKEEERREEKTNYREGKKVGEGREEELKENK